MKQAKEKHAGWIRIDVNSTAEKDALKKFFGDAVFLSSPHSMQPRTVLDTDIRGSEEDMLLHMKPKTRYNIRLAKKKKVEISVDSGATRIDEFYKLVKTASDRAGIAAHPKSHYETIVRVLPRENVSLYFASYRNVTVAAALVIFYKENALYLHGGSSNYFREAMAPYLLHFQVMLDAKRRGCNIYSFGGIQENGDAEKSSWAGITRFKTGFSPKTGVVRTVGSYDIVIAPFRYGLYRLFGKIFSLVKWLRKQVGRILK